MHFSSWLKPIAAIPVGLFITFFQSHSPAVGLYTFATFTFVYGAGALIAAKSQRALLPLGLASLIALGLTLVALTQSDQLQISLYLSVVAFWASIAGIYELYLAWRAGFSERDGRDLLISSVLTFGLALLFLIGNLDIVSAVGFFGAYLILLGVHWGIAAAGPKAK